MGTCFTVAEMYPDRSSFSIDLLRMEPRFRVYALADEMFDVRPDHAYYPTKEHLYLPVIIPALSHEIAHMVEMRDPVRWTLPDWGFPGLSVLRSGFRSDAGFYVALAREARVCAIERHMQPTRGNKAPIDNEGTHWEWEAKRRLLFGRFRKYDDVLDWVKAIHESTYAAWGLDRIRHEWEVRLNHIREWMETR
jgi:hypothetical protein